MILHEDNTINIKMHKDILKHIKDRKIGSDTETIKAITRKIEDLENNGNTDKWKIRINNTTKITKTV